MTQHLDVGEVISALEDLPISVAAKMRKAVDEAAALPLLDDAEMRALRAELALHEIQEREVERLLESHKAAEEAAPSEDAREERKLLRIAVDRLLLRVVIDRTGVGSLLDLAKLRRGEDG